MYLRSRDYDANILKDNLAQVIANDPGIRLIAERRAQSVIIAKLQSKYDINSELTDTPTWKPTNTFYSGSRAEFNFAAYDPTKSYTTDATFVTNYVIQNGSAYLCTSDTPSPAGVFNAELWESLCPQYELFYLQQPYPTFNYKNNYNIGDSVYWRGKVYTSLCQTFEPSHQARLHAVYESRVPNQNYFPDETPNGVLQWGTGTPYKITPEISTQIPALYNVEDLDEYDPNHDYVAGDMFSTLNAAGDLTGYLVWQPFNGTTNNITPGQASAYCNPFNWVAGDNRDEIVLDCYIAITLKRIHSRIAPRNIPEIRLNEYGEAMRTLQKMLDEEGMTPPILQLLQPMQGNAISWGGITRNQNQYD